MVKLFDSLEEATNKIAMGESILLRAADEKGEEENICLSHTKDGFFAVQNKCSHSGADLYKGFINEKVEVVCPLHGYCFDLKTGHATRGNTSALKTYRLEWKEQGAKNPSALFIDL